MSEKITPEFIVSLSEMPPRTPLLDRLAPDIYSPNLSHSPKENIIFLVNEFLENDTPFVDITFGPPKVGKSTIAGEKAILAAHIISRHHSLINPSEPFDISGELGCLEYEWSQKRVEKTGWVPAGHGPGHQNASDHLASSGQQVEEIYDTLRQGKNAIVSGPLFAGRGDPTLLHDLANHTGIFTDIDKYNVRFTWPFPTPDLEVHTRRIRSDFDILGKEDSLLSRGVIIHRRGKQKTQIESSGEILLASFNRDFANELYSWFQELLQNGKIKPWYQEIITSHLAFLATPLRTRFLKEIAPFIIEGLGIDPELISVCTNEKLPPSVPVEYYSGILEYCNVFSRYSDSTSSN